jgi:D-glycero-alpha-D-manno-heptose-7-phosphate kinase
MIITKAPLRMSFVGGGSDMSSFYSQQNGSVISTTIDKYVYVALKSNFGNGYRICYSRTEICEQVEQIEHPIIRECLKHCKIDEGLEIVSMADIPGSGSGLGSSSTFTVALLKALYAHKNIYKNNRVIAEEACEIEITKCGEPIGKQDQYAAAIGGFNKICFFENDTVTNEKVFLNKEKLQIIEDNTLVLFTGKTRSASKVLQDQSAAVRGSADKRSLLLQMVQLVDPFIDALQNCEITQMGYLLHENWQMKKQLSTSIADHWLNSAYQTAMQNGAIGGKIMGAGAGGFFLFIAPPERHESIASALGMAEIPVSFSTKGCEIIFSE